MPASVNIVQSSATEEEQGEISGVSRSVSNFGSSFGVALAGAILVSTLITGVTDLTDESTVLPPEDKQAIAAALEGSVTAVSDEQVEQVLAGQPEEIVDEVVRINATARNRAMRYALASLGVAGLIGGVAALFLPGRVRRTAAERSSGQLEPSAEIESHSPEPQPPVKDM